MARVWKSILFVLLLLMPAAAHAADRDVKVSLRVLPPFVVAENGQYTGFSVDLWNAIAARQHWHSTFTTVPNVDAQLNAVTTKAADVGVGGVSITAERDLRFDFSQPLLNGGLQILVRSQHPGPQATALGSLLHLLFSPDVLVWLGIAVLLTVVPAHIIWFMEQRHPEGIIGSKKYFPGIFQAFFWGLGTLATQADSMPRHWVSRVVAILWMFTSVVFVAFYTATLTATLTVASIKSEINGPDDLPGKTVATVTASTASQYLHDSGIKTVMFATADDAAKALTDNKVDAVVYDAPVLQYLAAHESNGDVAVTGPVFHSEDYGFALRNASDLRRPIDETLLALREDGTYNRISDKWFGKK